MSDGSRFCVETVAVSTMACAINIEDAVNKFEECGSVIVYHATYFGTLRVLREDVDAAAATIIAPPSSTG